MDDAHCLIKRVERGRWTTCGGSTPRNKPLVAAAGRGRRQPAAEIGQSPFPRHARNAAIRAFATIRARKTRGPRTRSSAARVPRNGPNCAGRDSAPRLRRPSPARPSRPLTAEPPPAQQPLGTFQHGPGADLNRLRRLKHSANGRSADRSNPPPRPMNEDDMMVLPPEESGSPNPTIPTVRSMACRYDNFATSYIRSTRPWTPGRSYMVLLNRPRKSNRPRNSITTR